MKMNYPKNLRFIINYRNYNLIIYERKEKTGAYIVAKTRLAAEEMYKISR